jgi:hypothetical protein
MGFTDACLQETDEQVAASAYRLDDPRLPEAMAKAAATIRSMRWRSATRSRHSTKDV